MKRETDGHGLFHDRDRGHGGHAHGRDHDDDGDGGHGHVPPHVYDSFLDHGYHLIFLR